MSRYLMFWWSVELVEQGIPIAPQNICRLFGTFSKLNFCTLKFSEKYSA